MQPELFDAAPFHVIPAGQPAPEKVSADRKRTARQLAGLGRGRHPISGLPLHPQAAPAADKTAAGLRCRDCRFRQQMGGHARSYPKCYWPDPSLYRLEELPRVTMGAATDCRAWFPACTDFEPATTEGTQ